MSLVRKMIRVEATSIGAEMGDLPNCIKAIGCHKTQSVNKKSRLDRASSAVQVGVLFGEDLKQLSTNTHRHGTWCR